MLHKQRLSTIARVVAFSIIAALASMTRKQALLLVLLLGSLAAYVAPELRQDRIFPYDSAVYAATGAFFRSLGADLPQAIRSPMSWAKEYYQQYPVVGLRRHPPVFALVEGCVYWFTGISVFGANLTAFLFAVVCAIGLYATALRLWKDEVVAFAIAFLFLACPQVLILLRTIWLDLPALAFALWVFYGYARRLDGQGRSWHCHLLMVLFAALALYTYQLPAILFAGLALHLLVVERRTFFKDKKLIVSALLLLLLMAPLAGYTIFMARDNLGLALGKNTFPEFVPVQERWSWQYWSYYAVVLWNWFPVQAIGLLLWLVVRACRRPTSAEWLFCLCFSVAYVFFSWMPSKGGRYAIYIAFAATPLTVLAGRDLLQLIFRSQPAWRQVGLVGAAIVAAIVPVVLHPLPLIYVTRMNLPAEAILAQQPAARIFYAGHLDAAFVFYVRQADAARQARVYRATVQLEDAKRLADFLEAEKIDCIVWEKKSLSQESALHRDFRRELEHYLAHSHSFAPAGQYDLLFGVPGQERSHPLLVYVRTMAAARQAALLNSPAEEGKTAVELPAASTRSTR
jgi:4-amino-4-deoxy-L-arabinose transferase-like glycosyltransferase